MFQAMVFAGLFEILPEVDGYLIWICCRVCICVYICMCVCVCVFVNDRNTRSTESFDERDLDHSVILERIQRFVVFERGRCEEARAVPLLNDTCFPIRDDTQFFNRVPRDRFGDGPDVFFVFVSMDKKYH